MSVVSSQSGNALFIILIAVALFAALGFAVTDGTRGNTDALTQERARIEASGILEYANNVANAVAQLRLRGNSDTQISFENDVVSGYANGNCSDDLCKIFHPQGGGMNWVSPSQDANDGSEWFYGGQSCIDEVGTGDGDCSTLTAAVDELIMFLPNVDSGVCVEINEKLGITNPSGVPPQETGSAYDVAGTKWTGTYSNLYTIAGSFEGLKAGCFEGGGTPATSTYHFYKVLIAR